MSENRRSELKIYASHLPGCIVVIDKRTHTWSVIRKADHATLDYGSTCGVHATAAMFLDYAGRINT